MQLTVFLAHRQFVHYVYWVSHCVNIFYNASLFHTAPRANIVAMQSFRVLANAANFIELRRMASHLDQGTTENMYRNVQWGWLIVADVLLTAFMGAMYMREDPTGFSGNLVVWTDALEPSTPR